ncbi:Interferon alpha-inducible protein 27 [Cricetulus griseus]|uniref:Interferon alpha-inducible protein 27 n=1 Tax=Cricetulus griseus TaxID=10029 RepID=G3I289_CRIGR|nr:Interferon alpha-inducible protein 27 [Cricetulus griseus]
MADKDIILAAREEAAIPAPVKPTALSTGGTAATVMAVGRGAVSGTIIGAAIGGVGAVIAAPIALSALGFTGAGIAAGSIAAKMMSAAAIANGGGVAAGSLVATLQSVGAVGLSASSNIILGSVGAAVGAAVEQASETLLEFIKQRRDPTEESEDSEPEDDPPNP